MKVREFGYSRISRAGAVCAAILLAACISGPAKKREFLVELAWIPSYDCNSDTLFAAYSGKLTLSGLDSGEHIEVLSNNTTSLDTLAQKGETVISLYSSEFDPPTIGIKVGGEERILSSADSIGNTYIQPLLHSFSISLSNTNGSKTWYYSLMKGDTSSRRVLCIGSMNSLKPDTAYFNATAALFKLSGDFQNSAYNIALSKPQQNSSSYITYSYSKIYAPLNESKSPLHHGTIEINAKVDTVPSVATIDLSQGLFRFFILQP